MIGGAVSVLPQGGRAGILDRLRFAGLVDGSALHRAQLVAERTHQPVEQVLNQLGSLSDDDLVGLYAECVPCEIWSPATLAPEVELEELGLSAEFLRRARLLPLRRTGNSLVCAACDPLDQEAVSGLTFATGLEVRLLAARPSDWRRAFDARFADAPGPVARDERRLEQEIEQVSDGAAEGAGSRLVAAVFQAAIAAGASDIHFEPRRNDLRIRLRIDGQVVDHQVVSADLAGPAVSRVKVIANLDLGERRLPQDGRTSFVVGGRQVDVRVATSPTVFGESAVLRILDRASVKLELDALGFSETVAAVLRRAVKVPHGLFLMTGPTGSGKTTTLYALLKSFERSTKKILSIEDPVEYHFEHVSQTQVAAHLGLTFASALRSFLRQDPDVILVGEIRDPETAAVAVQAAMTGHFVLASVHANDALAVIPRLRDMGVEPYQLAAGFKGAAAQRLVRRLCRACARQTPLEESERLFAKAAGVAEPPSKFEPVGCAACRQTGYRGRIAIAEAFLADDALLRAVAEQRTSDEVTRLARKSGLAGMAVDGIGKAEAGLTTFAEVMAAVDA